MNGCLAVLLSFAARGVRADSWPTSDKVLLGSGLTLTAIDWAQTRYMAKHPDGYTESNPIIGPHPSTRRVDAYFLAAGAAVVGVAFYLPGRWRTAFLGGLTVVETAVVLHNHAIGLQLSF